MNIFVLILFCLKPVIDIFFISYIDLLMKQKKKNDNNNNILNYMSVN